MAATNMPNNPMQAAGTRGRRAGLTVAVILGLILIVGGLGSCVFGGSKEKASETPASSTPAAQRETTEFNIPALFFAMEDAQSFVDWAKAQGAQDAVVNGDGSVTVTLQNDKVQAFLDSLKQRSIDSMNAVVHSSAFPNISKVEHSDDLRTITITMDKNEQGAGTTLASSAVALPVCLYQQMAHQDVGTDVTVQDTQGNVLVQETYPQAVASHASDFAGTLGDQAKGLLDGLDARLNAGN